MSLRRGSRRSQSGRAVRRPFHARSGHLGGDPAAKDRAGEVIYFTDHWNADRLIKEHGHVLRYVDSLKHWLHYDGRRWRMDRGLCAQERAKESARRLAAEAMKVTGEAGKPWQAWARNSQHAKGVNNTMKLAMSDRSLLVYPNQPEESG